MQEKGSASLDSIWFETNYEVPSTNIQWGVETSLNHFVIVRSPVKPMADQNNFDRETVPGDSQLFSWTGSALFILSLSLLLVGCARTGTLIRGQEVNVRYGEVKDVEEVQRPSEAAGGAVMGGFLGLMLSSGRSGRSQLASGLGGAALGAAATSALEGDRTAYSYRIVYNDNSESRFVTVKGYLQVGDCVAIERGSVRGETTYNARRVPSDMCSRPAKREPADLHEQRARQCLEAKEQLLAADTPEAVETSARKVSLLCQ
jgi:outer membrane lipoprotein SlyB